MSGKSRGKAVRLSGDSLAALEDARQAILEARLLTGEREPKVGYASTVEAACRLYAETLRKQNAKKK